MALENPLYSPNLSPCLHHQNITEALQQLYYFSEVSYHDFFLF